MKEKRQQSDFELEEILNRMVSEWQSPLLKTCLAILGDEDQAKDAVQETFIKAYRALPGFRKECSEKTWLIRIAINVCRDMRRSAWWRLIDRKVRLEDLPEPSYATTENDSIVMEKILLLSHKQKEVIILYYYHDMSEQEIAQALRISQPSVSRRLQNAKKHLKSMLMEVGYGR